MATYHYRNSKLIDRIEVNSAHLDFAQATIITRPEADPEQLQVLRQKLGAHDCSTMIDVVDGKPAIQVRGFKDSKALMSIMAKAGFPHSHAEKTETLKDQKQESFANKLRDKSLFLSALFYDLGNISLIISGIQRGRHNPGGKFTSKDYTELGTGIAFSVGDVLMTAYGKDKGDEELNAAAEGLKTHLKNKGIEVPKGNELNPDMLHKSGALKETDRWLRKHIVHLKCFSEFAGGMLMIHAGSKRDSAGKFNNDKRIAGLLIATGWLTTFLLEKPRGHQVLDGAQPAPNTMLGKLLDNPRGWVARPLAMGNNLFNLKGIYQPEKGERDRFMKETSEAQRAYASNPSIFNKSELDRNIAKQHDYNWNVLTAGSFLVAHTLFGISGSKRPSQTEDDKAMMQDLVLLSANMLAKQPEATRQTAIEETADYVSQLSHVKMTKKQVQEAISQKVESLSKSGWAGRVAQPSNAAAAQHL